MAKMQAWNVYTPAGEELDTVFFSQNMTEDEVKTSLINVDGYPDCIEIEPIAY